MATQIYWCRYIKLSPLSGSSLFERVWSRSFLLAFSWLNCCVNWKRGDQFKTDLNLFTFPFPILQQVLYEYKWIGSLSSNMKSACHIIQVLSFHTFIQSSVPQGQCLVMINVLTNHESYSFHIWFTHESLSSISKINTVLWRRGTCLLWKRGT